MSAFNALNMRHKSNLLILPELLNFLVNLAEALQIPLECGAGNSATFTHLAGAPNRGIPFMKICAVGHSSEYFFDWSLNDLC
jgi:hypothetical protein